MILGVLCGTSLANDSSSGCGVGWMVFRDMSLVSSSLRSTTNAFFSNTLAMTTGTSGCAKHSIVENKQRGMHYTESNLDSLMIEMAKGQGEYLSGLAYLFGCENNGSDFGTFVRKNYGKIFTDENTTGVQVYNNLTTEISKDGSLSKTCHII